MCFSENMSLFFGLVGFGATYYLYTEEYKYAALGIFYFSLMEIIQFFQYKVIDQCDNITNKILTIIGYLHICFQPIFFNLWLFEFTKKRDFRIIKLGIIAGLLLASRLLFVGNKNLCDTKMEPLCGKITCAFSGQKHIAWNLRLRSAGQAWFTPSLGLHFFMWVAPALTLMELKPLAALLATGPYLGFMATNNIHEMPAIWCFSSIAQLVITFIFLKLI